MNSLKAFSFMNRLHTILIADDDDGHAFLIEDNLRRGGVTTNFLRFCDGQEALDFLFGRTTEPAFQPEQAYLLLLDIRMPKVDGVAVLQQIKADPALHKLPVIMLTTTQDPREVDRCHELGCNIYIHKPVSFDTFANAMAQLGKLVSLAQMPRVKQEA
jgi:CheY-like chemotaxis protein